MAPTLRDVCPDAHFAQVALALRRDVQSHGRMILECVLCEKVSRAAVHGAAYAQWGHSLFASR